MNPNFCSFILSPNSVIICLCQKFDHLLPKTHNFKQHNALWCSITYKLAFITHYIAVVLLDNFVLGVIYCMNIRTLTNDTVAYIILTSNLLIHDSILIFNILNG